MKDDKTLKRLAIEQLTKTPIIQVMVEKIGLARATFYRWKQNDKDFSEAVDKAIAEGRNLVNDFAESQLINAIKNSDMRAITYWLNHNNKHYTNKLELSGSFNVNDQLTPEQEELVKKALELASFKNTNQ